MSDAATWTQITRRTFANSKANAQNTTDVLPREESRQKTSVAPSAQPSWRKTFAFPAYSGFLEIV